uniref:family 78 glycoside hydrolase catalytic domain n=1 Tax=Gemmiger formicilis TaxID=745368 RepID=UPI003FEE25FE
MRAINLKTNHLTAPLGMDAGPLFLSWQCVDGVRQTAYEIELTANGETVWHSGKVQSAAVHADAPTVGGSRVRGCWRVRLWDENDTPGAWSEAHFETGLAQSDWQGEWVDPETEEIDIPEDDAINAFARPNWERKQAEKEAAGKGAAEPYKPHRPASYLRKTFTAAKGEARLYITAKGLYAVWLNGVRVGDMVLAPGSFTGNKHLAAQTYDVTQYLRDGENELLVALGDGWHRSTGGVDGDRDLFGDTLGVLFQLEVNGKPVCISDGTMQATQCGPIRQNDMQQGEVYDARFEGNLTGWHGVRTYRDDLPITGINTVPILEHEAFPSKLLQTPNGETVLDFGQNIAGYVEMALTARAGQKVKLTCGEALDENGNFTQENFQDRARHKEGGTAQMLELVCKEGKNHFKPHFTIMGFRYAKIETDADLTDAVFTAHAVYSDMAVTGKFACGNDAVNQLVKNSIWSQKGNFCDIPTDCPTRERAGWTGDMGVFIETGLTLMDCYPVAEKWLAECRLNQYPDGRMANIAPPNARPGYMTPMLCMSAGWGDAA